MEGPPNCPKVSNSSLQTRLHPSCSNQLRMGYLTLKNPKVRKYMTEELKCRMEKNIYQEIFNLGKLFTTESLQWLSCKTSKNKKTLSNVCPPKFHHPLPYDSSTAFCAFSPAVNSTLTCPGRTQSRRLQRYCFKS